MRTHAITLSWMGAVAALTACSSSDNPPTAAEDSAVDTNVSHDTGPRDSNRQDTADSSPTDSTTTDATGVDGDGDTGTTCGPFSIASCSKASLGAFTSPGTTAPNNQILFTASGEVLALGGYAFPPATAGDPAFVDGWEFHFTHFLATFDKIRLNTNPDTSPTDQSQVGSLVAELDGPWAVDLHNGGPLPGKGGTGEQAVPIAILANQNKAGGAAFDTTVRYAFSFDSIAATKSALNVDLDDEGLEYYQYMIDNGYVVLYAGTATFKGTGCTAPAPAYDFTKLPTTVNFVLGFKTPTSYVNCQNPDNDPAPPISASEAHQRGVQTKASTFVVTQVTFHTDHPFWESVVHDSPAHFDVLAARHTGVTTANVLLDDVKGVDFTDIKDDKGTSLTWRSCVSTYTAKAGHLAFDPTTVPVDPSATPDKALRDLYDFMVYNQSTQGHLNSDGLAAVKRNYPSPP